MLAKLKRFFNSKPTLPFKLQMTILAFVVAIFVSLAAYSWWNQYFADTLIAYVPAEADMYAHFSLPTIKSSAGFNAMVEQVMTDIGLAGLPIHQIKRETAAVGFAAENGVVYAAIIRTNSPKQLKDFLNFRSDLSFKFLDHSRVAVSRDDQILSMIGKRDRAFKTEIKSYFSIFDSARIFIRPDFWQALSENGLVQLAKSNLFKNNNEPAYFSAQVKRGKTVVYSNLNQDLELTLVDSVPDDSDYSLILKADNLSTLFSELQSELTKVHPELGEQFMSDWQAWQVRYDFSNLDLLSQGVLLAAKSKPLGEAKIVSPWVSSVFSNHDFYLKLNSQFSDGDIEDIEDALIAVMAWHYPVEQIVYLSDGTPVTERRPDVLDWEFLDSENGQRYLVSPDLALSFIYRVNNDGIEITTNEDWLSQEMPEYPENYLLISTKFLPGGFWSYLSGFEFLEVK